MLVLGGNHGDEYQGKIAIMKLARELTSEKVSPPSHPVPALRPGPTRPGPLNSNFLGRVLKLVSEG
ncbi:hypothetical protein [Prosthecobacter sp.]|uniref:hypothetical protein n=1 Tax=Prosthecobacter sp. TaxID=1965333 RepID=UPI0037C952EB